MVKKQILLFCLVSMAVSSVSQGATVIFDLNGVLVNIDRSKATRQIGYSKFLSYMFSFRNPFRIKRDFFDLLDQIKPRTSSTPAATDEGMCLLPQLMCDWMSGALSTDQMHQIIQEHIDAPDSPVARGIPRKLFHALNDYLFNPVSYLQAVVPNKRGCALAQCCAHMCDTYGNKKNRLIILSNWDAQSFELLCQDPFYNELFSLFDDVLISACMGKIKPDIGIYLDVFCRWDINPDYDETILIDDQQENIDAFNQCGKATHGILCKDFKSVNKQLKQLGVMEQLTD